MILSAIILAATLSTVDGDGVIAVQKVTVTDLEQTIIAVPWLSAEGGDIAVADIIKTANLNEDDKLLVSINGQYYSWELENGAWVPRVVAGGGADLVTAGAADATLARGNGVFLWRGGNNKAADVYLHGRVGTTSTANVTMAKGTSEKAVATLLAPPRSSDTDLNTGATWSGVDANDMIVLSSSTGGQIALNWDATNSKWGVKDAMSFEASYDYTKAVIPGGWGAWYLSAKCASNTASVTWQNIPAASN